MRMVTSVKQRQRRWSWHDLRAHFRPEFLNRLDETIMFKPLTKDNIHGIIDLLIARFEQTSGREGDFHQADRCSEELRGRRRI